MISLILSIIVGFIAHRKFKPVSDRFPAGWNTISDYSAGGVLVICMFPLHYLELRDMQHGLKRAFIALVLTFFGVGGGTVAGWLSDTNSLTAKIGAK
jgi:hypothetical protein